MSLSSFWRVYLMTYTATLSPPWGRNVSQWVGISKKFMQKILCVQSSLLEMWRFNEAAIEAVTREEVIEGVNRLERRQGFPKFQNYPMIGETLCPQPLVWFLPQLLLTAGRGDQELQWSHHCCHQCAHGLGAWGSWYPGWKSCKLQTFCSGGPLLRQQGKCWAERWAGACRSCQPRLGGRSCGHRPQPLHPWDQVALHWEDLLFLITWNSDKVTLPLSNWSHSSQYRNHSTWQMSSSFLNASINLNFKKGKNCELLELIVRSFQGSCECAEEHRRPLREGNFLWRWPHGGWIPPDGALHCPCARLHQLDGAESPPHPGWTVFCTPWTCGWTWCQLCHGLPSHSPPHHPAFPLPWHRHWRHVQCLHNLNLAMRTFLGKI